MNLITTIKKIFGDKNIDIFDEINILRKEKRRLELRYMKAQLIIDISILKKAIEDNDISPSVYNGLLDKKLYQAWKDLI